MYVCTYVCLDYFIAYPPKMVTKVDGQSSEHIALFTVIKCLHVLRDFICQMMNILGVICQLMG